MSFFNFLLLEHSFVVFLILSCSDGILYVEKIHNFFGRKKKKKNIFFEKL